MKNQTLEVQYMQYLTTRPNLTTWAVKVSDSVVIIGNNCEKTMIIAIEIVSMAGTKLSLFLIAQGKTELVEKT